MLCCSKLKYCLTKILWLITLLAQLILNTESRDCVRSRNPGDNKAVGCDFSDWLWRSNHRRKKSCLSWDSVAYKRENRKGLINHHYFYITWDAHNKDLGEGDSASLHGPAVQLTCHCCGAGCGKIKAGDFFVAILLNTDELSFIYHTRLQAWDGVGVLVARNSGFLPRPSRVFLQEQGQSDSKRLPSLQAGVCSEESATCFPSTLIFQHRYGWNG